MKFKTKTVTEIPPVQRTSKPSKYTVLFDEAAQSKTGKTEVIFETTAEAQSRAGYIRRTTPSDGWKVEQRGASVFISTPEAAKADAKDAKS